MRRSPNWHPAQLGNKSLDLGILGAETPDGVSVSGARMADLVNHLGGVCRKTKPQASLSEIK